MHDGSAGSTVEPGPSAKSGRQASSAAHIAQGTALEQASCKQRAPSVRAASP